MEQPLIAIVDDDESVRDATERLMRSAGFSAETFSRGADFLSSPGLSRTACLVTDLNMPGMSGFDLHRRLQSLGRSIPTILITGQPNENVRTQALSLGIICYLPKPFPDDDLIDSIHSALRSRRASGAAVWRNNRPAMRASIRRNISAASTGRVRDEIDPSANLPLQRNEGAKAGILRPPGRKW